MNSKKLSILWCYAFWTLWLVYLEQITFIKKYLQPFVILKSGKKGLASGDRFLWHIWWPFPDTENWGGTTLIK